MIRIFLLSKPKKNFRLFKLGRIISAVALNDKTFVCHNINNTDIPLNYSWDNSNKIDIYFEIDNSAFANTQDWLGIENLKKSNGIWYANVTLPNNDNLVKKLLAWGQELK